ncbi:phosphodiester glycosidase family protein, partial [bacterium]|nr:phosphodiester glycosidase family protein [bacterium]
YKTNQITFPTAGIAHIKKIKYINSKPVKINIVEVNTRVNPYLKIKPQTASEKLNAKSTVRKIAQRDGALIAINGGFFKPQTGVPLGALMIDRKVLTGPIYNRVGIAIFEHNHKTSFKMANIDFIINAKTKNHTVKIDNINQPRMLQSYMLLYTSDWGKTSPLAPKTGWNMLIRNNKVIKISANPIEMISGDMVLQGNKETISKLAQDKEIDIDIKLQDELKGAKHIISAGPYLVKNSALYVDTQAQKLQAISGKNPRSAIGYKNDGTLIIVTVDGREESSVGMTLKELAILMKGLGCDYAMNFDGGSSSAIYVKGKIANQAVSKEGIAVSNALTISEINPYEMQLAGI